LQIDIILKFKVKINSFLFKNFVIYYRL
jgi:hypothetical protein